MSQQIFTNKGEIESGLSQVKSVIGSMEDNLVHLRSLQQKMLDEFKGTASERYNDVANQLGSRVDAYAASLNDLDKATNHAATLIGDADTRVAGMFANLM
ncbi:WXG100 family type VII secretion target [Nocardia sp. NPDC019395]|uniref:WXG100 family type VII secretion target n=1 Tax=Nocardia sp. NPDC019395 TaxID=3154686 RepID=UPI0033D5AB8E